MTRNALARTYRPRRFSEMAMQEHVSTTLRSAVARDRVAQAYLFCGPRGIGKTTAARILAMALNCPNRTDDGEPCGTCESCERIWGGRTSLDVVEIDAASNRGVDDARELRERAMYAPTDERRFKVYIVDEAHMLTREAWNALLKILEEPPPRVIFVFATTEPQKIQQAAPPILSRCQRFDFRRITVAGIVERLQEVIASEGVDADPDALIPLARRAEGGLRDALSLLDQVLSFADGRIEAADVRRVLGLIDEQRYLDLFRIIADGRHAQVFEFVRSLLDEGYDLAEFYRGLADAIRRLLIIKLEGAEALDETGTDQEAFREAASRFDTGDLLRMLAQVAELDSEGRFRKSGNPRIMLEALLLRFTHLDRTVELEALIRAAGGAEIPAGDSGGPAGTGESGGRVDSPAPHGSSAAAGVEDGPDTRDALSEGAGASEPEPPKTGGSNRAAEAADGSVDADAHDDDGGEASALERARRAFDEVLAGGELPAGLRVLLRAARVDEADDEEVTLVIPPGPALDRLTSDPVARRALQRVMSGLLDQRIRLGVRPAGDGEGSTGAPNRLTPETVKRSRLEQLASQEPVLGRAVEEWDLDLLE